MPTGRTAHADRRHRRLGTSGARPLRRPGLERLRLVHRRPRRPPRRRAGRRDRPHRPRLGPGRRRRLPRGGSARSTRWPAWPEGSRWPARCTSSRSTCWRKQLALNLDTRVHDHPGGACGGMVEHERGSIVYIGSRAAVRPFPGGLRLHRLEGGGARADAGRGRRGARPGRPRQRASCPTSSTPPQPGREPGRRLLEVDDGGRAGPRRSSGCAADDSAPLSGGIIPAYGRA